MDTFRVTMDETYDDFFTSIGQATCLCAILVVLGDFHQIIIILISLLVLFKMYEKIYEPHRGPNLSEAEWKYLGRMEEPRFEVIRKMTIRDTWNFSRQTSAASSGNEEVSEKSKAKCGTSEVFGKIRGYFTPRGSVTSVDEQLRSSDEETKTRRRSSRTSNEETVDPKSSHSSSP